MCQQSVEQPDSRLKDAAVLDQFRVCFKDAAVLDQFRVCLQNPYCNEDGDAFRVRPHFMPQAETVTPHWLKAVAPEARVNSNVPKIFDSFKDGDQCFAQVMQSVTGKPYHHVPIVCIVEFLQRLPLRLCTSRATTVALTIATA